MLLLMTCRRSYLLTQFKSLINGSAVVFKGSCFSTSYSRYFHCYKLHSLRKDSFFFHQQLPFHLPVHARRPRCFPHDNVVIMPFSSKITAKLNLITDILLIRLRIVSIYTITCLGYVWELMCKE